MHLVETIEIEITAIHDIDGSCLENQLVEDIDIVNFARGYDDDGWYVAVQVQKGMELYRTFAFPEFGPWEKCQTQFDSGRVQGVSCLFQVDAKGVGSVKFSGLCDKDLSEIGINPPVPVLIGVGQGISRDLSPNSQMIKSGLSCPQTSLDISQAFSIGELGEGHT